MNNLRTQMEGNAAFSHCCDYRYALTRYRGPVDAAEGKCNLAVWIGLNPSIANDQKDDPTMKQIIAFTKNWGYDGCLVVNLFARVATKSTLLKNMSQEEAVGPANDSTIKTLCQGKTVYVAWGNRGRLHQRDEKVLGMLADVTAEVRCLGLTKKGHPRHPLYVRLDTKPVPLRSQEHHLPQRG